MLKIIKLNGITQSACDEWTYEDEDKFRRAKYRDQVDVVRLTWPEVGLAGFLVPSLGDSRLD